MVAVVVAMTAIALLAAISPAAAQQVAPFADDLRDRDATYEQGSVDDAELAALDRAAADAQTRDAFFKVIVLNKPVSSFGSTRAFAQSVLAELDGDGRLLVLTPDDASVVSNVDADRGVTDDAARAAADAIGGGGTSADAVEAAADALSVDSTAAPTGGSDRTSGGNRSSGGGGGSGAGLLLVVGVLVVGVVGLVWVSRRKKRTVERTVAKGAVDKMRSVVDRAANLVVDLDTKIDLPTAPAIAKQRYQEGSELFANLHDELDEADTREEIEHLYPKVVEACWKLDCAQALLNGQAEPAHPPAEDLFPAPALPSPNAPEVGTRRGPGWDGALSGGLSKLARNPWITNAVITAIQILAQRGSSTGGRGSSGGDESDSFGRRAPRREPAHDNEIPDIFGSTARIRRRDRGSSGGGEGSRGRGVPSR